jgi:hypothetical protein
MELHTWRRQPARYAVTDWRPGAGGGLGRGGWAGGWTDVAALAAGDAVVATEWITIAVPAIDMIIHEPMSYARATTLCCIHIYIMLSTNRNIPYLRQETTCSVVVNLRRVWYVVAGSNPLKTIFFAINASGSPAQGFFTIAYRAVYRCYCWGTVTVPSGSNQWQNSNLNLNSKNEKINKNLQKIVHDS